MEERATFDFYRCQSCRSLLTADDETRAHTTGDICECGGRRYSPTWPLVTERGLKKVVDYMAKHDLEWPPDPIAPEPVQESK